jgi:AsmA protein
MSGSLTISSDSGELANFDASGLRRLAADRAYFQLSAAGSGSFDYRTLDMAVRFADGSAEVERARIVGEDETLVLSGIIPYSRQALALTGELLDTEAEQRTAPPLRFFIGGSWNDPVISPIPGQPASGQ